MNRTRTKSTSTLGLILAGILFLGVGLFSTKSALDKKKRCTEAVTAIVTEVKEKSKVVTTKKKNSTTGRKIRKTSKKTEYTAVITYDFNNVSYTNDLDYSSSTRSISEGDKVEIHIDPNSPDVFYSEKAQALLMGVIMTAAGVFAFGVGIIQKVRN